MAENDTKPQLYNRDAEEGLLGLLFADPTLFYELQNFDSNFFFIDAHKTLYIAMFEQYSSSRTYNATTLSSAFRHNAKMAPRIESLLDTVEQSAERHKQETAQKKQLAENQGDPFKESDYTVGILKEYSRAIRDNYCLWRIKEDAKQICSNIDAWSELRPRGQVLEDAVQSLEESGARIHNILREGRGSRTINAALHDTFQHIQDIHDRKSRLLGLPTGFYEVDDIIGGLQPGMLYVIGGRPSMGKSSILMNILENIVLREGKPAGIFSMEMSEQIITRQMLCSHARVDSTLLNTGRVSEEEFQKLVMAAGAFHESGLHINDFHGYDSPSLDTIVAEARKLKRMEDIAVLGIDYLQLVESSRKSDNRSIEVGYVSHAFKNLAKTLNIPIIVLSQLNRGTESREDGKPRMSDLRESGAIEQDADVVMLLYREEYYRPDTEKRGVAEVIIAKNRTGPIGNVDLAFLKQFTKFENLAAAPGHGSW